MRQPGRQQQIEKWNVFKEKKRQEKEHYRIDKDKNMTTEKMKNTSAK